MVRRRYVLLNRYSQLLSNRLNATVAWARGNRGRSDVKEKAMARAKRIFDRYFDLLMPYVWRTRIKPQLGKDAVQLDESGVGELAKLKVKFLTDFEAVLDDALSP